MQDRSCHVARECALTSWSFWPMCACAVLQGLLLTAAICSRLPAHSSMRRLASQLADVTSSALSAGADTDSAAVCKFNIQASPHIAAGPATAFGTCAQHGFRSAACCFSTQHHISTHNTHHTSKRRLIYNKLLTQLPHPDSRSAATCTHHTPCCSTLCIPVAGAP